MALTKRIFRFFDKNKRSNRFSKERNKRSNKVACFNVNKKKKLHLVRDLDHTLLHAIPVPNPSQDKKYQIDECEDLRRVVIGNFEYLIKLRPFLLEFLQEANKLFHMYVYKMGTRSYAQTVLEWIDPKKVYFGNQFMTRERSPDRKTLELLSVGKSKVVIVDDSDVWPIDKKNLVKISKYMYFRDKTMSTSYAEKKKDESENEGALANVLQLLQKAHERFEDELDSNDLREIIDGPCKQFSASDFTSEIDQVLVPFLYIV